MQELLGTVVAGNRITESLYSGSWDVYRGQAPDGARVIVTVTCPAPPPQVLADLALSFEGIPPLRTTAPITVRERAGLALIESEPVGTAVADLRWPLPISEVVSVGLDLARLLARIHATGAIFGSLRPQTTWIHTVDGRSSLAGTTSRPERAGLHCLSSTLTGTTSPFAAELFCDDTLARDEPRSVSSDVAQLGMMLYRMATRTSPFVREPGESVFEQVARAVKGEIPPWPVGDAQTRTVEELAREAFDPARAASRSLASLLAGLEQNAR